MDECVDGILKLMDSDFNGPVNIGSDEMVTINQLAYMIMEIANKPLEIVHIVGPIGVRGRSSDNNLIKKELGWAPSSPLKNGLKNTYHWISSQINV